MTPCACTTSASPCEPDVELTEEVRAEVQRTFAASFAGTVEVDGLNRLVLLAGLTGRQVEVLRAYVRYLRQIGFPFGQPYIEATLCRHAAISAQLVGLFDSRFDPRLVDAGAGRPRGAPRGSSPRRSTPCPASTTTARCAP